MDKLEPRLRTITSDILPGDLPFPAAVQSGDTIYVSGNIGNIPGSYDLVPGGIGPQTRQTLENMKTTVELSGSALNRVLKCTCFITDMADFAAMNEVYREFFVDHLPARSTVAVKGLAFDALVEIECIALIGNPAGPSIPNKVEHLARG